MNQVIMFFALFAAGVVAYKLLMRSSKKQTDAQNICQCVTCKKDIAVTAKSCPHCGEQKPHGKPPTSGFTWAVTIFIGFVSLLALLGKNTPERPPTEQDLKYTAGSMCEIFVKRKLKAPSTADFAGRDETNIEHEKDGTYSVISWVEAQNAFGAKVRSRYVCEVIPPVSGDVWNLKYLTIGDGL